jgi:hypothetical protein
MRPFRPEVHHGRQESGDDENRENREIDQPSFGHEVTSFRSVELEADVLQSVSGLAVQPGCRAVVSTPCGQVALGDPRRCTMAS